MDKIETGGLVYDRDNADTYETTDLNRVGKFCEDIAITALDEVRTIDNMRHALGVSKSKYTRADYSVPEIDAKTDFAVTDTYTVEQMQRYLLNVQNTVDSFPPAEKAELPSSMRGLTAQGANAIEKNLIGCAENLVDRANATERNITNTADAFTFGGEMVAGGIV